MEDLRSDVDKVLFHICKLQAYIYQTEHTNYMHNAVIVASEMVIFSRNLLKLFFF